MNYTVIEVAQRSPEWFAARAGRLTASRAGDMLKKIKTGEAAGRRDLRMQLVTERLTGISEDGDGFVSAAMQRGIDREPDAFAAYEALTGQMVTRVGFVQSDDFLAGCSPDGIIGGGHYLVELKCPKSATHLRYVRADVVPKEYVAQITHAMWVTGAEWCDFVSFDDRFPPALQLFVKRVERADVDIEAYERAAVAFLEEVDAETQAVRTMAHGLQGAA